MARKRLERTEEIFGESEVLAAVLTHGERGQQQLVPVNLLLPNRFNPRHTYSEEALEELIQSMREYGFMGALDGRQLPDGRVELAYGSRRLLAAKAAGIEAIPVFLRPWDDQELLYVALVENIVREDLTPQERAATVGRMHEELGLSVREIARRINKPKSWVEDHLALHRAPEDVRQMVAARPNSMRIARLIAPLPDKEVRLALEEKVIDEDITTRQVQEATSQIRQGKPLEEALATLQGPRTPEVSARADSRDVIVSPEGAARTVEVSARADTRNPMGLLERATRTISRLNPSEVGADELRATLMQLDVLIEQATRIRAGLAERLEEVAH